MADYEFNTTPAKVIQIEELKERLDRLERYALGKCYRCAEIIHLSYSNMIERPGSSGEILLCHNCYEDYCRILSDGEEELYEKKSHWLAEERNKHIKR